MAQTFTFWRFVISGVVLVVGGVFWLMSMETVDTQDKFGVTQFYNNRKPKSPWVSVNGRLDWESAAYEGSDYSGTWYVPMVSRDSDSGDKVKLIVKVSSHRAKDWGEREEVEGMLTDGLPRMADRFFRAEGPQPSDSVMLLTAGVKPGHEQRLAHIVIAGGVFFLLASIVLYDPDPTAPSTGHASRAVPRTLGPLASDLAELRGEIAPDDPKIVEREDAVQKWMREHGLQSEQDDAEHPVDSLS